MVLESSLDSHRRYADHVLQFTLHTCAYRSFVGQTRIQRRDKMQINTHSAVVRASHKQQWTRVAQFLRQSRFRDRNLYVAFARSRIVHESHWVLNVFLRNAVSSSDFLADHNRWQPVIERHVCVETRITTFFLIQCVFNYK